jgi:predicted MFS family arabinose efflux permease
MMPMNPVFQEVFGIDNTQFGYLVSSYAASAGMFGFIAFFFIDRFDRKNALLFLYFGFTISTLGCALAQNYNFFLVARIASGAFGGVLAALVLAIIGDVFPESRRGRATGIVMSAFSIASIIGIPLGLYLAVNIEWHFPFYLIAGLSSIVIIIAWYSLPSLKSHMYGHVKQRPHEMLAAVFYNPNLLWALLFMCLLMLSGFMVIPYLSDYMVSNVGFTNDELKYIYLFGGCATVISGPMAGRLSDKFGKQKVFMIAAFISLVPILLITNLSSTSKVTAYTVTTLFFIFFGGRFIPAMSMITSSAEKKQRGGFMSISGSFQQLSSALAALIGGAMIGEGVGGQMLDFWIVGLLSCVITLFCVFISFRIKQVS